MSCLDNRCQVKRLKAAAIALISCLAAGAPAALAQSASSFQPTKQPASQSQEQGQATKAAANPKLAADAAKQFSGGKVLRVQPAANGHRVKVLLPSGKVSYIRVDASGNVVQ